LFYHFITHNAGVKKDNNSIISWCYARVPTDNVAMEMFLELLEDNELLLAVAYDEASAK